MPKFQLQEFIFNHPVLKPLKERCFFSLFACLLWFGFPTCSRVNFLVKQSTKIKGEKNTYRYYICIWKVVAEYFAAFKGREKERMRIYIWKTIELACQPLDLGFSKHSAGDMGGITTATSLLLSSFWGENNFISMAKHPACNGLH